MDPGLPQRFSLSGGGSEKAVMDPPPPEEGLQEINA